LKPSELTPLTALELASLTPQLGFPPGVLNVLTGYGIDAGAPLVEHPLVRKVAFTGSVATGSRVAQAASQSIKKFTLELGGKSALIAHKDADVDAVVDWASFGIFWNAGQNCTATSRLLLHEDIYEPVLQKLRSVASRIKIGGGFDRSANVGPIIN
jgi:betaine-aldehyde dehydrogenase